MAIYLIGYDLHRGTEDARKTANKALTDAITELYPDNLHELDSTWLVCIEGLVNSKTIKEELKSRFTFIDADRLFVSRVSSNHETGGFTKDQKKWIVEGI